MKQYYHLFNALPFACLLLELKGNDIFIKDVNERFLGNSLMKKEELLGRRVRDAFPENPEGGAYDWEQVNSSLRTCIESGENQMLEELRYDLPHPETGVYQERHFCIENRPIPNEQGQLGHYILNITHEVTEKVMEEKKRLELEKELHQQRELGKYFIEKNNDGLFSIDREGRFLSMNQGGLLLSGLPEEELLGHPFLEIAAPYERERLWEDFQAVLGGQNKTCEADYLFGESPRHLSISLFPMEADGAVVGCYGIAHDVTAQRQAEEKVLQQRKALEQSERKHKTLIEKASDLVCISNMEGRFTFISESYQKVLGYAPKDLLGRNALELVHPKDLERVYQEFGLVESESLVQITPYRFKNAVGGWRWMETLITDLRQDPLIEGLLLNTRDVTETVERTLELEQLNESYRMAARATKDIIYEWDLLTNRVNLKLEEDVRILGHVKEVVQHEDFWSSHLHSEDRENILVELEETFNDSEKTTLVSQYRIQRADGTYAHFMDQRYIIRDPQGRAIRIIGAKTDISERVRHQEELALSNKRFSLAMKATNEMIWDWDLVSNEITRSELFLKNYGYAKDELQDVREDWLSRIPIEDRQRVTTTLFGALADPEVTKWHEDYFFLMKDGRKAYVKDRGYIVRDAQGKALRMVGAALDVTEAKGLLTRIEEKNKVLREVAWEQSHIVRAPLVRLMGLLDFMEKNQEDVMTQEEVLRHLQDSADELDEIIRKIVYKAEEVGAI